MMYTPAYPCFRRILWGNIGVLWEQILSFKSSRYFLSDSRHIFPRLFLGVRKNNSVLAMPLVTIPNLVRQMRISDFIFVSAAEPQKLENKTGDGQDCIH